VLCRFVVLTENYSFRQNNKELCDRFSILNPAMTLPPSRRAFPPQKARCLCLAG